MIGVIAGSDDGLAVREFFELFKTPWEFYRADGRYQVLLCCRAEDVPAERPALTVVYGGRPSAFDVQEGIAAASHRDEPRRLRLEGTPVPIYGKSISFGEPDRESGMSVHRSDGKTIVRFGYDLAAEVRTLLTSGQPVRNASVPTLDLHIRALRRAIISSGVDLAEIPPVPEGYSCIACLTHDVDHPSIRRHRFDHTVLGFLYRAVAGSVVRMLRGRLPVRGVWQNWLAAARLPLVYLGLARDFWFEFERYQELEQGAASTFFVIPFADDPGRSAPRRRAARYGAANIAGKLNVLASAGCEIGLHGIDAWRDRAKGREEVEEIRRVTGRREIGARMHWLYHDENTPLALEAAGADYDSTVGYNETVGYRAGTAQVYKPLHVSHLLELPLHIMDTALFYPSHLNLAPGEAKERCSQIIANAVELGGCVTVNWHDRSIAPERLWGGFYAEMTHDLKRRGAWLATAAQAVAWFRIRRSATFEACPNSGGVRVKTAAGAGHDLPGLRLQLHNGTAARQGVAVDAVV
jgi:hypothetical protein